MSGWNVYNGLVREWSVTPSLVAYESFKVHPIYPSPFNAIVFTRVTVLETVRNGLVFFDPEIDGNRRLFPLVSCLLPKAHHHCSLMPVSRDCSLWALQRCKIADEKKTSWSTSKFFARKLNLCKRGWENIKLIQDWRFLKRKNYAFFFLRSIVRFL